MELRSFHHLHFIHAVKDGSNERVLNADVRGRPKLKLRQLEDIYKKAAPANEEWLPKLQPRAVRNLDQVPDMTDGSCLMAANMKIKHELEDYDAESKANVGKRDGNVDDLGFGDMTLEQIRKQCKTNKRKRQNSIYTKTSNSDSRIKQEYSTLQPEDEGCDLEKPLSFWATKFSKRRKEKKERKIKRGSASSSAMRKGDLSVSYNVKSEALEDCYPVSEAMTSFPADPLAECNKAPSATATGMVSIEVPRATKQVEQAISDELNELPDAVRQAECSVVEKFTLGNQENADPENALSASVSGETSRLVDNSEGSDTQNSDFSLSESGNNSCTDNTIASETSLETEDAYENRESVDPNPDLGMKVTGCEIVMVESPETLPMQYPGLPMVDFWEEKHITCGLSYNLSETDCSERNQFTSSVDYSSSLASQVQELDIDQTNHGLKPCNFKKAESSCEIEDTASDDLPDAPEATAISHQDSSQVGPDGCMISVNVHQLSEKRQSASSVYVDTVGDHESTRSSNGLESDSIQQHKRHHPPEKLFSGRKVISPDSQAKLRKAAEQIDSPEKRSNKCKGKLYFSSQNAHRILKTEGLGDIERIQVIPNTKQSVQKPNNFRQTQYQKPALKAPRQNIQAAAARRFSTACTSIQGCSQNAIAFSKRQMHDIQNLAAKLTNELQSMKEITERCLQAEGSPSKMSKCSADEVKVAIRNAERAEETARKWLSMMERDCSRFGKLMGMIQEDSAASGNIIPKKKKITFADEAGGDLCHVKVFEIDLESPSLYEP